MSFSGKRSSVILRKALFLIFTLLASQMICVVLAAPSADEVTSLPDYPYAFPSRHYSGYLTALNGSFLHYYLVNAQDVSPATAPVVFWTNGGPGCSSMEGWGYELGPFQFRLKGQTNSPTFSRNDYTWAKYANLVFVENPPGVGFSYRIGGNYSINDLQNAENSYAAILDLFQTKFPEYSGNPFYLSGESYAGIYIPSLAQQILMKGGLSNFVGVLVGNGVTDRAYDANLAYSYGQFAAGHGFISVEQYQEIVDKCIPDPSSADCETVSEVFWGSFNYLNPYGVTNPCFSKSGPSAWPKSQWPYYPILSARLKAHAKENGFASSEKYLLYLEKKSVEKQKQTKGKETKRRPLQELQKEEGQQQESLVGDGNVPPSPPVDDAVPCDDSVIMGQYLNRQDVRNALHVGAGNLTWALCYWIRYEKTMPSVVEIYNQLMKQNKSILIYNGNVDMVVPYTGTRNWIFASTHWKQTREYKPWIFNDTSFPFGPQTGGLATQYENKVWFVLVNGAGHMVPQDRPAAALEMFRRFIQGDGFPEATVMKVPTRPANPAPVFAPNNGGMVCMDRNRLVPIVCCAIVVFGLCLAAILYHKCNPKKKLRSAEMDQSMLPDSERTPYSDM